MYDSGYSRNVQIQPAIFTQNFSDFSFFNTVCGRDSFLKATSSEQKVKLCKLLKNLFFL